jgi:hypothetical protein
VAARRREAPRVEILGTGRHVGFIGVTRPENWTGRATSTADQAVADAVFLQAWGEPLAGGETFAGAARYEVVPSIAIATAPVEWQPTIQPTLRLQPDLGRMRWELVARSNSLAESPSALLLELPAGLRGWVPLPIDPSSTGAQSGRVALPWLTIPGRQFRDPEVVLVPSESGRLEPVDPEGLAALPASVVAPGVSVGTGARFRVLRASELQWTAQPPAVEVRVQSDVALEPTSTRWDAVVRTSAFASPVSTLAVQIPAGWNPRLDADLEGCEARLDPSRDDAAKSRWSLRFDPPLWGEREIRIQGSRTIRDSDSIELPDVQPLGRGRRTLTLSWANRSGRPRSIVRTQGVSAIDPPNRATEIAANTSSFRVVEDSWGVTIGPAGPSNKPRITLADVTCVLSKESGLFGSSLVHLAAPSSEEFGWRLPDQCEVLEARAEGRQAVAWRNSSGEIRVTPGGRARDLELLWRIPAETFASPARGVGQAELPRPIAPVDRWAISAYAPDSAPLESPLPETSRLAMELARLHAAITSFEGPGRSQGPRAQDKLDMNNRARHGIARQALLIRRLLDTEGKSDSDALTREARTAIARADSLQESLRENRGGVVPSLTREQVPEARDRLALVGRISRYLGAQDDGQPPVVQWRWDMDRAHGSPDRFATWTIPALIAGLVLLGQSVRRPKLILRFAPLFGAVGLFAITSGLVWWEGYVTTLAFAAGAVLPGKSRRDGSEFTIDAPVDANPEPDNPIGS